MSKRVYIDGASVKGTGHNVVPMEQGSMKKEHHGRADEGKRLPQGRGMSMSMRKREVFKLARRLALIEQERAVIMKRMAEYGYDFEKKELR